jgi:eukaryotic-like serine/threonine-protein kinase
MTNQKEPNIPAGHDKSTARAETSPDSSVATPASARTPKSQKLELPLVVGNRYKLLEPRGGGGMAKVYRAFDLTLERDVAVKIINAELRSDPEFDARFQREARVASQLADPHIVVVHDFGFDADCGPFIVMEFLQGQTLRERLATAGPLPLKAGLQLCAQLLLALIHAHNKGIIHRDIKPDNVFILNVSGVRLHVRVLDFGIARILRGEDTNQDHAPLTQPGAVLGTPRYMAPEQLAGQPTDARSDIYSAAMVIHEALTGKLPFVTGKTLKELCPDASDELCALITQCLKPNPNERPPNVVEVYLRIQELGKASGILLLPPGAMEQLVKQRGSTGQGNTTVTYVPRKPALRSWWLWPLIMGAVIALAGLVGWLLHQ